LSLIHDNEGFLAQAQEEKSESVESDCSSIPSEHINDLGANEYTRRYALKISTITQSKDSHGLFDFEARQGARETFVTSAPGLFIRVGESCQLVKPSVDIRS